eukprot:TRINITY_DN33289_c0_g2_i1.p1 TRINITY_DN33289_c0_g2~~TRINITY_DN33289_c0_g2_i1.p1  ORF type:complete len:1469 (+),score=303.51 TRINITY_DN33289_c0_g2_i1:14-4420(+)
MSDVRWTWADASLLKRGLARASPLYWKSANGAVGAISQLEALRLKDQRRPIRLSFKGKELKFTDAKQALAFLRPHADHDRANAARHRQPLQDTETALGDTPSESATDRVRKALHCKAGHPIQKKGDAARGWFNEKRKCHACETAIGSHTIHWRCSANCSYNVCNHCFQTAVWNATQVFAERSEQHHPSEASTSEGPPSIELATEGPCIELQVTAGDRKEAWMFDSRSLKLQVAELVDSLGFPVRRRSDGSIESECTYFLVRNTGSEIEIIQNESHLHALIPNSTISLEAMDALISARLSVVSRVSGEEEAETALGQLLAIVSACEELSDEALRQDAFSVLEGAMQHGALTELACACTCALLRCPQRRSKAMSKLGDAWNETGRDLLYSLLLNLFPDRLNAREAPLVSCNATLTVLLWTLEEVDDAVTAVHAICYDDDLYSRIAKSARASTASFPRHASCLVLCGLLKAATRLEKMQLASEIRQEVVAHTEDLAWLDDLLAQHGSSELLAILASSCAHPETSLVHALQQEVQQLRDEKHFTEKLQGKLRQSHNAMREMVRFMNIGDPKIEEALNTVICQGWASMDWPEGYTLLHLLCEHSHDLHLIRLVAQLCPDLEARDDKGNRPMDYALRNPNGQVAQCIVSLSQDRAAGGLNKSTTDDLSVSPRADIQHAKETADRPVEDTDAIVAEDCTSDPNKLGTVYMLRTHLTSLTKENESLREKVAELELLRMHLARLEGTGGGGTSDHHVACADFPKTSVTGSSAGSSAVVAHEGGHGVATTQPAVLEVLKPRQPSSDCPVVAPASAAAGSEPCETSPSGSASPASAAEGMTTKSRAVESENDKELPSDPAAVPTNDAENGSSPSAKGKGKGKAKGKAGPPLPSSNEQGGTENDPSPSATGKGKGKAKGKAGPPPPSSNDGGTEKGKGKGKSKAKPAATLPTKPAMLPGQDMKTLPWTRFIVGAQIEEGTTIWDKVSIAYNADVLPMRDIEKRFGKQSNAGKVEKAGKQEKKAKLAKLESIPKEQRFQLEVSLKTLPLSLNTGRKAATAILDLNRALLSAEMLTTLHRYLCPTPEQQQELTMKRQLGEQEYEKKLEEWTEALNVSAPAPTQPGPLPLPMPPAAASEGKPEPFRWDPLEQYMEELSQVPACSMRLSCWAFLRTLPDRLQQLQSNLDRFEQMVRCFHDSQELPCLLGLVLAFGNYLNGGKNEKRLGQADGFHIELLGRPGGLDVVNDPTGKNVRSLIFQVLFDKFPAKAELLLEELSPLFALVQRRLGKDSDGVPQLNKSVRVQIEELDKQMSQLKSEFAEKREELKEGLKFIPDPADKFVVEIPEEFERGKSFVDELVARKDLLQQQFKALLSMFKAETYRGDAVMVNGQLKDGDPKAEMTSEVWCMIWDNFFIPKETMLSFDEKRQKESLDPRFCKESPITVESLEFLWGLRKPQARRQSAVMARKPPVSSIAAERKQTL